MAYVYASQDVEIAWSGIPFTGLAKDSFVTITPNADVMQGAVGADGLAEVSYSPDLTGTVTVSLQQGSDTARLLAAATNTRVSGDLTIVDPSGSIFVQCRGARIMSKPEITRGENAGDNTNDYVFWCEELFYTGIPSGISGDVATFASGAGSLLG